MKNVYILVKILIPSLIKTSIPKRYFCFQVHMGTHMWSNGASRRGRRMSLDLPPIPMTPKDSEFLQRRPDLFYPYLPAPFLNGMQQKVFLILLILIDNINPVIAHFLPTRPRFYELIPSSVPVLSYFSTRIKYMPSNVSIRWNRLVSAWRISIFEYRLVDYEESFDCTHQCCQRLKCFPIPKIVSNRGCDSTH